MKRIAARFGARRQGKGSAYSRYFFVYVRHLSIYLMVEIIIRELIWCIGVLLTWARPRITTKMRNFVGSRHMPVHTHVLGS